MATTLSPFPLGDVIDDILVVIATQLQETVDVFALVCVSKRFQSVLELSALVWNPRDEALFKQYGFEIVITPIPRREIFIMFAAIGSTDAYRLLSSDPNKIKACTRVLDQTLELYNHGSLIASLTYTITGRRGTATNNYWVYGSNANSPSIQRLLKQLIARTPVDEKTCAWLRAKYLHPQLSLNVKVSIPSLDFNGLPYTEDALF